MSDNNNTITVFTSGPVIRKPGIKDLDVNVLGSNINLFLVQVEKMMEQTPETVGKFQFVEFEVHADISADGKLVLMGTGVEAGISGGLKFKFVKNQVPVDEKS